MVIPLQGQTWTFIVSKSANIRCNLTFNPAKKSEICAFSSFFFLPFRLIFLFLRHIVGGCLR